MEYGEKGFKWKSEGMLIALPVTCGKILRAAQGAYNYMDPPAESPTVPTIPNVPTAEQAPEAVADTVEPVTPLKESKDEFSKKRKSIRNFRDELTPMKESFISFISPAKEIPNMIRNSILTPTKDTHEGPPKGIKIVGLCVNKIPDELTFVCIICKKHISMEALDTHSQECSTYDDHVRESLRFIQEMKITCVICKLQIPYDLLDTHSTTCYADKNLKVDVKLLI
jgi:hypothetical protein